MKVTVTKTETTIDVEGESHEIRDAVPAMLSPTVQPAAPALPTPTPLELAAPSGSLTDAPPVVRDEPEVLPLHVDVVLPPPAEPIVLPHERVGEDDEWEPETGPASAKPTTRIEDWKVIPRDRLVWNAIKQTAHVARTANDPDDLFCGHHVGMPMGGKPNVADPKVCGSCNRHIEIEARS